MMKNPFIDATEFETFIEHGVINEYGLLIDNEYNSVRFHYLLKCLIACDLSKGEFKIIMWLCIQKAALSNFIHLTNYKALSFECGGLTQNCIKKSISDLEIKQMIWTFDKKNVKGNIMKIGVNFLPEAWSGQTRFYPGDFLDFQDGQKYDKYRTIDVRIIYNPIVEIVS